MKNSREDICGLAGRCVRSFSVQVVNPSCVSLTWTLFENCSTPDFMVVQWSSRRHQGSAHHRRLQGGHTWVRLPYSEGPAYLTGNHASLHPALPLVACAQTAAEGCCVATAGQVFDFDDDFYLYPVFADREGEPVFATGRNRRLFGLFVLFKYVCI